jgi:hypothetical protein
MTAAFRQGSAAVSFWRTAGLNLNARRRDQGRAPSQAPDAFGDFMQTIRPDNTDPIPLRNSSPRMGTIMIRFVGLLVLAVFVLAFAWSR